MKKTVLKFAAPNIDPIDSGLPASPVQGRAVVTPSTAGHPVNAIDANQSGGYITNPASAVDQGLPSAESLYVNPVTNATLRATNTTIELKPGQSFFVIPNSTTPVSVASASPNHRFTSVQWA